MNTLFQIPEVKTNSAYEIMDGLDISANSKKEYKARLEHFLQFVSETGMNRDILVQYKRRLENRIDLGVSSRNKYFNAAKQFLKECYRKGHIQFDVTTNVKQFKQTSGHKKFGHTSKEVSALLSNANTQRDRAILSLMIYQGLRQCEIVRLEIKDLNFDKKTAMIQGKGRDDKEMIHLHSEVVTYLKEYIEFSHLKQGMLFNVTDRTIRNIHSRLANKLGIKATAHGLRHYFTTRLLQAYNGDVKKVKNWTRHKCLETIMIYNDEVTILEEDVPIFEEAFSKI